MDLHQMEHTNSSTHLSSLTFKDAEKKVEQQDGPRKLHSPSPVKSPSANLLESPDSKQRNSDSPRSSPDLHCAICLSRLENKSFTDSCFHQFCFTCLLEWSKVKAECPLCKQSFKSIIHNVRSIEDYDQYYIAGRTQESRTLRSPNGRRFRYPSTLTSERRRHLTFEQTMEFQNYRHPYASHSFRSINSRFSILNRGTTSEVRRRIYENGEWVRIEGEGALLRYRETSPEFYRQNPACTHRLIPWLNRELVALLLNSENQVTFVLELILALIMRYGIRSEEFYEHILPYLQDRTSHFIHEFYNYARSVYDMPTYDEHAQYDRLENLQGASSNTSSPSSIIEVPIESFLNRNNITRPSRTIIPTPPNNLELPSSSSRDSLEDLAVPGPSGAGSNDSSSSGIRSTSPNRDNNHYDSDTEDDCIILEYVKSKCDRTPEVVELLSSSDDEESDSNKRTSESLDRSLRRARCAFHYDYSSDSCSERKEVLGTRAATLKVKIKSFLGQVCNVQLPTEKRKHHSGHKKHKKHKKHKSHKHKHRKHKRESSQE